MFSLPPLTRGSQVMAVLSAADSTRWAAGCRQPRGTPSAGRSSHQQGSASADVYKRQRWT